MKNLRDFVASIIENGGATFNLVTGTSPAEGFVVSEAGFEMRIINVSMAQLPDNVKSYIEIHGIELSRVENNLGAWMDGRDLVLDISRTYDCETSARLAAERNKQDAYYNLNTGEEVRL